MEREWLNSRQRRKVQKGVSHILDEARVSRSDAWKNSMGRLLDRFDRIEAEMEMSAGRETSRGIWSEGQVLDQCKAGSPQ